MDFQRLHKLSISSVEHEVHSHRTFTFFYAHLLKLLIALRKVSSGVRVSIRTQHFPVPILTC